MVSVFNVKTINGNKQQMWWTLSRGAAWRLQESSFRNVAHDEGDQNSQSAKLHTTCFTRSNHCSPPPGVNPFLGDSGRIGHVLPLITSSAPRYRRQRIGSCEKSRGVHQTSLVISVCALTPGGVMAPQSTTETDREGGFLRPLRENARWDLQAPDNHFPNPPRPSSKSASGCWGGLVMKISPRRTCVPVYEIQPIICSCLLKLFFTSLAANGALLFCNSSEIKRDTYTAHALSSVHACV